MYHSFYVKSFKFPALVEKVRVSAMKNVGIRVWKDADTVWVQLAFT